MATMIMVSVRQVLSVGRLSVPSSTMFSVLGHGMEAAGGGGVGGPGGVPGAVGVGVGVGHRRRGPGAVGVGVGRGGVGVVAAWVAVGFAVLSGIGVAVGSGA